MRRKHPKTATRRRDHDRAVSDVLAFILVFAIILSSVALLSMTGFQAMEDYQEGEATEKCRTGDGRARGEL